MCPGFPRCLFTGRRPPPLRMQSAKGRLLCVHTARSLRVAATRSTPLISRALSAAATSSECPYAILGIARGAPQKEVKARFYLLARTMHPDIVLQQEGVDAEAAHASFVAVSAAFEAVLDELEAEAAHSAGRPTAPSAAARGGGAKPRKRRTSTVKDASGVRHKSLGEVLCEVLREDPSSARHVWEDVVAQQCEVRETMLDELFRACASNGEGLPGALAILRDATRRGLVSTRVREAAMVSLIKWCKEDADSFRAILAEVNEQEKTPETIEMLSNANFLYSGYADGYNIKR